MAQIQEQDVDNLLKSNNGVKETTLYYVKRAKEAGDRMKVAVSTENSIAIFQEAQTMYSNIQRAHALLADDKNKITDSSKK